jgi:hypothetical protein
MDSSFSEFIYLIILVGGISKSASDELRAANAWPAHSHELVCRSKLNAPSHAHARIGASRLLRPLVPIAKTRGLGNLQSEQYRARRAHDFAFLRGDCLRGAWFLWCRRRTRLLAGAGTPDGVALYS